MSKRTRLKKRKKKMGKEYNPYAGKGVYKFIRKHRGIFGSDTD